MAVVASAWLHKNAWQSNLVHESANILDLVCGSMVQNWTEVCWRVFSYNCLTLHKSTFTCKYDQHAMSCLPKQSLRDDAYQPMPFIFRCWAQCRKAVGLFLLSTTRLLKWWSLVTPGVHLHHIQLFCFVPCLCYKWPTSSQGFPFYHSSTISCCWIPFLPQHLWESGALWSFLLGQDSNRFLIKHFWHAECVCCFNDVCFDSLRWGQRSKMDDLSYCWFTVTSVHSYVWTKRSIS